jgi:hypothetical protein
VSLLRARKGPRTILGLLAALGLVAALSMPALASHDTDLELVDEGAQSNECAEFDFGFKLDNIDELSEGVYTASDEKHTVWIEIELIGDPEVNDYEILDADPAIDGTFVKQPVEGGGISHLTFCYNVQESEAPPSEAPPSEPAESTPASEAPPSEPVEESEAPAESEAAPAESAREGELGGTPTPAPRGDLPDTAFGGDFGQMPATVLSLVLIAALAAMVYVRLARQR